MDRRPEITDLERQVLLELRALKPGQTLHVVRRGELLIGPLVLATQDLQTPEGVMHFPEDTNAT